MTSGGRRAQRGKQGPAAEAGAKEAERLWIYGRSGANASRGYHYQEAVGVWLCGRVLSQGLGAFERLVPEGHEDLSCEGSDA